MSTEKFLVITIDSTHLVMKVEKFLIDNEVDVRIIPLPGELKASCGLSLKASIKDAHKILELLKSNNIDEKLYSFYLCEKNGFKKNFSTFNF
ncbi:MULTISPECIES: DUF3343 domain-containing protein [Cetobacterium]|jgi:hypothetical protein|uniref:DUF3343 domain-containing protein n=1 Tax=Candidatus Cetobacterium colombiensis TaxID=3073100 RepID=A0ABU4W7Q3_9FUSO|nr:DUF3343 domain-containing protein [Candidatus Cetobacterium colombiensis]MDX8335547.1 DUF3343 domain-containing protein [Candidatus Cetobacterium colombiensis]